MLTLIDKENFPPWVSVPDIKVREHSSLNISSGTSPSLALSLDNAHDQYAAENGSSLSLLYHPYTGLIVLFLCAFPLSVVCCPPKGDSLPVMLTDTKDMTDLCWFVNLGPDVTNFSTSVHIDQVCTENLYITSIRTCAGHDYCSGDGSIYSI